MYSHVEKKTHVGRPRREDGPTVGHTYTVQMTENWRAVKWVGNFESRLPQKCAQRGGWFVINRTLLEGFLGWGRTPTLAMDSAIENALSDMIKEW